MSLPHCLIPVSISLQLLRVGNKLNVLSLHNLIAHFPQDLIDIFPSFSRLAYEPNQSICWPSVAPVSLVLWTDLYLRFVVENSQTKKIKQQIQTMVNNQKELRSRVIRLRKQLTDLKKEVDELGETGNQQQQRKNSYKINSNNDNCNANSNPLINGAI